MKKIEEFFLNNSKLSMVTGVRTARILETTQNFINTFFDNKNLALALHIRNNILTIGCQNAIVAEELRLNEKKLIQFFLQKGIGIENIKIKFMVKNIINDE